MFICILLSATAFPLAVNAGSEDDPEVEDRIRDVMLFGRFPFIFQFSFKYVDIVSAWMNEEENNPDYLYLNLKVRDLEEKTKRFDAIYVISWTLDSVWYSASVHIFPYGPTILKAGPTDEEGNDYVDYVECEGKIDTDNDVISWIVPKDGIGSPNIGQIIENIVPHTHLRFPEYSGFPLWDLFKDLPWNANYVRDYQVKY
jgi:hypothetical protein